MSQNVIPEEVLKYPPITLKEVDQRTEDMFSSMYGRFHAIVTRKQTHNHWMAYVYTHRRDYVYVTGRGSTEHEALRSLEGELKRLLWLECMDHENKMY